MRIIRILIHGMLLLAILSTGLPLYQPADMNRDGRIGLSDAIVSVRELAQTVADKNAFREGMENTLIALSVTAGLKSMVRADRNQGTGPVPTVLPAFIVDISYKFAALSASVFPGADQSLFYHSPSFSPVKPPPRNAVS